MSSQYINVQYNGYNIYNFKYLTIKIKNRSSIYKSLEQNDYDTAKYYDKMLLKYIERDNRKMVLKSIENGSGDLFVMLNHIYAIKDNKILEYILSNIKCVTHNSKIITVDLNYLGHTLYNSNLSRKCKFDFVCGCQLVHHINFN